jgi:two-component system sensor histidine kinase and response regulator WspE
MTDLPANLADLSMMELFRLEVEAQATPLRDGLQTLEQQPNSIPTLESLMRIVHAVKGAARVIDLDIGVNLANAMKECFAMAAQQRACLTADQIATLRQGVDGLVQISQVREGELADWLVSHQVAIAQLQQQIETLSFNAIDTETIQTTSPAPPPAPPDSPPPPPTSHTHEVPDFGDTSMLDLFRLEVEAQVEILNDGLLVLESQPQSPQALESLMRAAHSIKGAARIVAIDPAVELAHVMEDCFVAAQNHIVILRPEHIDVLLRGTDWLSNLGQVDDIELGQWLNQNQTDITQTCRAIAAILKPELATSAPTNSNPPADLTPVFPPDIPGVTPTSSPSVQVSVADPIAADSQPTNDSPPSHPPTPPHPITDPSKSAKEPSTADKDRVVRVSAENLNRIMGLAGESLIAANWLQPYVDSLMLLKKRQTELSKVLEQLQNAMATHRGQDVEKFVETARQKEQECREILVDRLNELELFTRRTTNLSDRLYREVIASHMRPFADGIQGFPRMIRDLARKLNKQVKLEITGKSTPVDRDILKKLEAPLTHILRNSVDHGIELPEERLVAGKPAEGTIRLEAVHRGGMLSITVSDDGRGIDLERLRQKIVNKGLSTLEMTAQMSDSELIEFLFLPGFSTAQQVTEISGRGVGLDIAKSMVHEVGGTVRATTQRGKGIQFHFQLPLTLSVVRTLLVEISGEPYAFPLARIEQIVMVDPQTIYSMENRQYFTMNDRNIGLVAAYQVLEVKESQPKSTALPVIVISDGSDDYGLVIDRILGEHDLVVRPLDARLGKVQDINAAALLSDGSPVLIMDVSDLVRSIENMLNGTRLRHLSPDTNGNNTPPKDPRKSILVVDDSITVREMERKMLQNRGYRVDVAVDGMEGWHAVCTNSYDLVISDIDMPRMNGIELVTKIKSHSQLKTVPIIIVSYKNRDEDRTQGLAAGADYYLTKSSFHDNTLVNAVVDLIGA